MSDCCSYCRKPQLRYSLRVPLQQRARALRWQRHSTTAACLRLGQYQQLSKTAVRGAKNSIFRACVLIDFGGIVAPQINYTHFLETLSAVVCSACRSRQSIQQAKKIACCGDSNPHVNIYQSGN